MKKLILPFASVALFTMSTSGIAATDPQAQEIQLLSAQIKKLSAETNALKHEMQHLRAHQKHHHTTKQIKKNHKTPSSDYAKGPFGHFVTITTSPFLGRQTSYAPSDLLYEVSSMNEDLRLLKIKRRLVNHLQITGYRIRRPIVEISGGIEGQLYSTGGFNTSADDGVNLSTAEIDLHAIASTWASAFMSLDYNGSPISTGNRAPNAQIYLKRGFATLGNLNRTPFYGTIGLMYAPFGRYSSGMVSTPLTLSMARIRTETALLGASFDNGIFASIYGFGGSRTSGGTQLFKQGGANLGLKRHYNHQKDSYSLGIGWVSNIADSEGQQNTGGNVAGGQFGGFGEPSLTTLNNNNLVHNVDAIDAHGKLTYGGFTIIGEYLTAMRRFATMDMTFGRNGAEPSALHAEIDYTLPFEIKRETVIGFAYGETWEALALNLPKNSYTTFISTSLLRDTVESLEYRHDTDYAATDVASGRGASTPIRGTGKDRNSVIAQVGVYF